MALSHSKKKEKEKKEQPIMREAIFYLIESLEVYFFQQIWELKLNHLQTYGYFVGSERKESVLVLTFRTVYSALFLKTSRVQAYGSKCRDKKGFSEQKRELLHGC